MTLTLTRILKSENGIFGYLRDASDYTPLCVTLEHAYPDGTSFAPKLPEGIYRCQRGYHQLDHMKAPFQTFEVRNVPGHSGILFHIGNYNKDSSGCILLGQAKIDNMLTHSGEAFSDFMQYMKEIETFLFNVQNQYKKE